jgi:hypothetical protein
VSARELCAWKWPNLRWVTRHGVVTPAASAIGGHIRRSWKFDPVDAIEAVRDHAVVVSDRASAQMTAGGHPRFRMGGRTRPDYELQ